MGTAEAYNYAKIGKYGIDFVLATRVLHFRYTVFTFIFHPQTPFATLSTVWNPLYQLRQYQGIEYYRTVG